MPVFHSIRLDHGECPVTHCCDCFWGANVRQVCGLWFVGGGYFPKKQFLLNLLAASHTLQTINFKSHSIAIGFKSQTLIFATVL